MPLSYINPVFNNNNTTETETLSVTGVTTLGDNSDDTIIINAKTISVPNDININNNTLFIKNSNSRIGINTISPSQLLDVNGNAIVSGFFGIGTTSPSYKFHLVNTVAQGQNTPFQIEDNGTLTYYPNMTATLLNPAVSATDKGLIATNGTINTGSLFIGTWSNNSIGAGIRLISTGVNIFGNINIDSGAFFVDGTNNRVGVNNTSPTVALDVTGATLISSTLQVNGNVTIGTNNSNTITINALAVSIPNNLNFGSNTFFIDAATNRIGIGTNSPSSVVDIVGPASVTSFTGTTRLGLMVRGSTATTDYSGIDFIGNGQSNPVARIAALTGASGSTLSFGTSSTYASGITNMAMSIDSSGVLLFNSGYGSAANAYGCRAWVNFNGTSAANVSGTYSQSGTTVTVTLTGHGLLQGHIIYVDITSGTGVDGVYTVASVTSSSVFTYTAATATTSGNITLNRRTIRGSGNISSISYNGTGDYSVNFTTAMPDVNYAISGTTGATSNAFLIRDYGDTTPRTVNAFRIITTNQSATVIDPSQVNVMIFR